MITGLTLIFGILCLPSAHAAGERAETFQTYYENGALKGEFPVKNGHLDGPARWYYQSGALGAVMSYKASRLEGVSKTFYESGRVRKVVNMKSNRPIGVSRIYSESGRLSAAELHRQGRMVGLWYYDTEGKIDRCEDPDMRDYSAREQP